MNEEAFLTLDTFVIIVLLLKDWQIHALWSTGKELHSKPWIWNTRVLPYLCRWQKVQLAEWGQMKFRLYLHGCSIYLDAQGTLVGKAHLKPTFWMVMVCCIKAIANLQNIGLILSPTLYTQSTLKEIIM